MNARALHQRVLRSGRSALGRGRSELARRFGIDARALAAFRISLGALVFVDLLLRSRDLVTFYTDSGVLPRALLREQFPVFARFSLHALSGSAWLQALLFLLAGGCALALLLGYRTTTATVVSFVLLASLHARNPLVLNAGDSLLRRLLFWGAFLPLGRRWSVDALRAKRDRSTGGVPSLRDAFGHSQDHRKQRDQRDQRGSQDHRDRRKQRPTRRVVSVASAALLIQVVVVYAANAAFKFRGDHWLGGEAIQYALSLDQLTVFLGDVLVQYPLLLAFLDRVWLGLIVASPMLIVLTRTHRAVFASLFVAMHVGMALTMRLGIFPFVSITGLIPFLPPKFWDVAERRLRESPVGQILDPDRALDFDAMVSRVERALPSGVLGSRSTVPPTLTRWKRRVRPPVVAGLLALVLVWNAATLGYAALPEGASSAVDPEEHRWDMFAPEPRTDDGWYVVPGELSSGERRDVFHESAVRWDRPPDLAGTYPNVRWYKYLVDLQRDGSDALRHRFAEYLCERWNRDHETDVTRVSVHYVEQQTRLDGAERIERIELLRHSCSGGSGDG